MTNLWANVEDLGEYANSDFAYDAVKTSSYILWALSGRKYTGTTTVTERYVSVYDPYLRVGGSSLHYWPTLIDGTVHNIASGGFDRFTDFDFLGDGTSSNSRLRLRGRKVIKIHTVREIDGTIIDPSNYYLADHSVLYGAPNSNWTPTNVEVTYTYGTPPPTAGKAAARLLAVELIKSYEGDDTCALPERVTSVSRQGVNYSILDNQDFVDNMRTGLYAVDMFLKATNPDKAKARTRVFSPDTPRARRLTPKQPLIQLSDFDLYVSSAGGAVLLYLSEINADFLIDDSSWKLSVEVSNWTNDKTEIFDDIADLDAVDGTIRISTTYQDMLNLLGPRNPGVLDLYATRPSLSNPSIDEVVNIVSSNVIMQLGDKVHPITLAQ